MGEVLPIRVIEVAPQTPTAKCHRSLIYDLLQGRRMSHTFTFLTLPLPLRRGRQHLYPRLLSRPRLRP